MYTTILLNKSQYSVQLNVVPEKNVCLPISDPCDLDLWPKNNRDHLLTVNNPIIERKHFLSDPCDLLPFDPPKNNMDHVSP